MHSTMPIAPRALVQMKYTDTTLPYLPVPATAPTFLFFNLNSIYKPNRTYAGHQPYGHDTFAQLYNRYRIYKVKWTAIFSVIYGRLSNRVPLIMAQLQHH